MEAPRSDLMIGKLLHRVKGARRWGLGTFPHHSTICFYRGRELNDGTGLLQGSQKDARFITCHVKAV